MANLYTIMMQLPPSWQQALDNNVRDALTEDIGTGDITAQLIDDTEQLSARVITREDAIMAGRPWVEAVFQQCDPRVSLHWHFKDGDAVKANDCLFELKGPARSLLTGERPALNFLQTLSAVATKTAAFIALVKDTPVKLLDTRKTLPGLRIAQKYAVQCGGGKNHRIGLYDAFLIKENHIAACGSIAKAVERARTLAADKICEIEVEDLHEFEDALAAGADIIMLDNFSNSDKRIAVKRNQDYPRKAGVDRPKLEASGGINADTLLAVAETGVDYISMGSLTKDIQAVDLSMRIVTD